jgi:pimeloyl-ACP methyl ester carboxylesterase
MRGAYGGSAKGCFLTFFAPLLSLVLAVSCAAAGPAASVPLTTFEAAPSRFAKLDGYRVRYKSLGGGREALVFIHGWSCDLESWRSQVPAFASRTRVIVLDLPGHGGSDKPRVRYSMDLFARAVDSVMRDAGVEKAVLVGHSMGTPVARQFYRLYPGKTLALVAVDGPLRPYTTDPAAVEKFLGPFRGAGYSEAFARAVDGMIPPATPADTREQIRKTMLSTPQHVIVGAGEAMFDPAIWREDPIGVPVLCVLARSPFWSEDYEAFVRRLAPRLDYRVIDGAGHFLMMDRPAEFNTLLANFLSENKLLPS